VRGKTEENQTVLSQNGTKGGRKRAKLGRGDLDRKGKGKSHNNEKGGSDKRGREALVPGKPYLGRKNGGLFMISEGKIHRGVVTAGEILQI